MLIVIILPCVVHMFSIIIHMMMHSYPPSYASECLKCVIAYNSDDVTTQVAAAILMVDKFLLAI